VTQNFVRVDLVTKITYVSVAIVVFSFVSVPRGSFPDACDRYHHHQHEFWSHSTFIRSIHMLAAHTTSFLKLINAALEDTSRG
jgi:hypothetical protein